MLKNIIRAMALFVLFAMVCVPVARALTVEIGGESSGQATLGEDNKGSVESESDVDVNLNSQDNTTIETETKAEGQAEWSSPFDVLKKIWTGTTVEGQVDESSEITVNRWAVNSGPSSATISFRTNIETRGEVEYSTSPNFDDSSSMGLSLAQDHSVYLSGLSANTVYYFRVALSDDSGEIDFTSQVRTFETEDEDEDKPRLIFLNVFGVDSDSATVIWLTNRSSNGKIWVETDSEVNVAMDPIMENDDETYLHIFHLTDLSADTEYHLKVASGNDSGQITYSSTLSFMTDVE